MNTRWWWHWHKYYYTLIRNYILFKIHSKWSPKLKCIIGNIITIIIKHTFLHQLYRLCYDILLFLRMKVKLVQFDWVIDSIHLNIVFVILIEFQWCWRWRHFWLYYSFNSKIIHPAEFTIECVSCAELISIKNAKFILWYYVFSFE